MTSSQIQDGGQPLICENHYVIMLLLFG